MADEVDLYGDDEEDFNQDGDYNHDSNVDLYEDVLTAPSEGNVHNEEGRPSSANSYSERRHMSHTQGKRYAVYAGNLTWWTTDKDICDAVRTIGVGDVLEVKFFENRANGQSKGFCLIAMASETSYRTMLEKFPKKILHGKNPEVLPCSKQNLNHFENVSRKGGGNHGNHAPQSGHRYDNPGEKYNRERDREREKESRSDSTRGAPPDRSRIRSNAPPPSSSAGNQRQQSAPNVGHPPPPQALPPQYPPGRVPWMAGPPPQIYQIPPNTRPGMPPNTAPPPPPPGIQAPPPPRPIPPPHANVRVPPPRGPLPPMGPRNVPPPDPRAPPPQHDWERIAVSQPPPQVGLPSQPSGPPNRPPPPVPAPGQNMPPSIHPPAPHVNPAFFLPHNQPTMPPVTQPVDVYSRPPPVQYPEYRPSNDRNSDPATPAVSESEFEDIMNRNRTVSSSAISRAVADASAGDFTSAIETLVTAISLIKQSKIANDERCKILISSLQDTLHGVEAKSYSSSSRSKERPRSRERSRERSRRDKSSRRERSRSRDYRDRSRERDRYHDDRYHEKDHDRDRDRDRRSHRH